MKAGWWSHALLLLTGAFQSMEALVRSSLPSLPGESNSISKFEYEYARSPLLATSTRRGCTRMTAFFRLLHIESAALVDASVLPARAIIGLGVTPDAKMGIVGSSDFSVLLVLKRFPDGPFVQASL